MNPQDLSRRERRPAEKRLALLDAAVLATRRTPLAAVPIAALCEAADVSNGTFFHYFRQKSDLWVYFLKLWSIELGWRLDRWADAERGRASIEAIFDWTAQGIEAHPRFLLEVVGVLAERGQTDWFDVVEVTRADVLLRFADAPGIEQVAPLPPSELLRAEVARAIARRELPARTDANGAALLLQSVFTGVPLALARSPRRIAGQYRTQVRVVWNGLGGR